MISFASLAARPMCARDSRAALCQQLQNSCRLVTKGSFPPCPLTKEALCLRMLLLHFGFGDPEPTAIYCDKGAITMGLHPTNKAAMRQVRHTRTFLPTTRRSRQRYGTTPVCSTYFTYDMVADSSSKATPKPKTYAHTSHFTHVW